MAVRHLDEGSVLTYATRNGHDTMRLRRVCMDHRMDAWSGGAAGVGQRGA